MITSQIKLIRLETNDICTMGALFINGRWVAACLEPPKFGNTQDFSCIPSDTYNYHKRYSNHAEYEIIELENVYNRTYIQIHPGNKPEETSGCILPGFILQTYIEMFSSEEKYLYLPRVHKSKDALNLILDLSSDTGIITIVENF